MGGWTPPSKFIVFVTFLTMVGSVFILLDSAGIWPSVLASIPLTFGTFDGWLIIALVLVFLTWFLFFLGVKLSGI
ncbi:MAG: hypothetical protein ACW98D_16220 [Promethearchaeota archaeon]